MGKQPSPNGANGKGADGRFVTGNSGGPGNPHAAQVSKIREALLAAVTVDDIRQIIKALVAKAKDGDVVAARELLDRVVGKPSPSDVLLRVERLEELINRQLGAA